MATTPVLTFQSNTSPYSQLNSITYQETIGLTTYNFVIAGNKSDHYLFRVYNNWALATGIANALNVYLTTYDGVGVASHTASTIPVSGEWVHLYEDGYGENSIQPGIFSAAAGSDTAVGGSGNIYTIQVGSDGSSAAVINAGTNNNGLGFAEITSYVSVPSNAPQESISFAISCQYEWTS